MAGRVCPPIVGYILLNPLRRLFENPQRLLGGFVGEGMTVLEPGCAMGYFTLPLAEMVGESGKVVALDVQAKMLSVLSKRARKAGLDGRIRTRCVEPQGMGLEDLNGQIDRVVAIHVVHELPDSSRFFREVMDALKPDGKILFVEPKGHVSTEAFAASVRSAEAAGLVSEAGHPDIRGRKAILVKP